MNVFGFPEVLLASASPRRQELLRQIGVPHDVLAVDVDESARPGELPQALATRLARAKAVEGRRRDGAIRPVLGSDTVVVVDGQIFGKPADRDDALRMLSALSAREHQVITAVALAVPPADGRVEDVVSETRVRMRAIAPAEAAAYWESGEPRDKAGAYGIQGAGAVFIEHIRGSYSAVMGLPLYETALLLQSCGLTGGTR